MRWLAHQAKNCLIASTYAARVFLFRMVAVKNSMKRQAAASPARSIGAGRRPKPARLKSRGPMFARSRVIVRMVFALDGNQTPQDRKNPPGQSRHRWGCQSKTRGDGANQAAP